MTAPAVVSSPSEGVSGVAAPVSAVGGGESTLPASFASKLDAIIQNAPLPEHSESGASPAIPAIPAIPAGGVGGPPMTAPDEGSTAPDGVVPTTAGEATGPQGEMTVDDGDVVLTAERNADGTFKAHIDPSQKFDIKIRDAETGETKVYSKTIPEVLRMAKDGVWGQKVRDEVSYYREHTPQWRQEHQALSETTAALREELQSQMELNRELLTADEALVISRREEFAKINSPEQRLARMEAEERARTDAAFRTAQEQAQARQVMDFANARLAPVVADAVALVGEQRAKEMLAYDILPFQVNGRVPSEQLEQLARHLSGSFLARVRAEAASRAVPDPRIVQSEEAVRRAQAEAQRLANTMGRATAPVGSVAHAGADVTKPVAPPRNVNEAIDRIVSRPLVAQGAR